MKKLWLLFSQVATIGLAIWFVLTTLKPAWFGSASRAPQSSVVSLKEAAPAPLGAPQSAGGYSAAAQKAIPAVVSISTSRTVTNPHANDPFFRFFYGERSGREQQTGLGSGVIVSDQGYVLTNNHVIEGMTDIELTLSDGRRASAKVVGTDPESDLAVLKLELKNLPVITFGEQERAKVGDVVLAIGNPFGVGQTVTMGIVSALGRDVVDISRIGSFIQTDAAINPGNSGGALIDAAGNLLGINTAIYSRSGGSLGIGFAIPASAARTVLEQIIGGGSVVRGYLGVGLQELTPELAEAFALPRAQEGVVISAVMQAGPADRAGIKPGDLVVELNGEAVKSERALLNKVAAIKPDEKARVKLLRKGAALEFEVIMGKRPRPRQ